MSDDLTQRIAAQLLVWETEADDAWNPAGGESHHTFCNRYVAERVRRLAEQSALCVTVERPAPEPYPRGSLADCVRAALADTEAKV